MAPREAAEHQEQNVDEKQDHYADWFCGIDLLKPLAAVM
jgi:hypothetical protein